jgi:hypothetical protein
MGVFLGDKPVTIYFNGASASLPVQGVFLGPVQVFPAGTAAATLYFDGAVDSAWTTVGNWWLDAGHNEPAGRLPNSVDSVVVTDVFIQASGQTVVNFTFNAAASATLGGSLTVTGMATFNGESENGGTITGNATFNDSSPNSGTVSGNATFNDGSTNSGTVSGNATFNDGSINDGATVTGNATFNDSSTNSGTVSGNATFNDGSYNLGGTVTGTATFTGSACNDAGTAGTFVPNPPPSCE